MALVVACLVTAQPPPDPSDSLVFGDDPRKPVEVDDALLCHACNAVLLEVTNQVGVMLTGWGNGWMGGWVAVCLLARDWRLSGEVWQFLLSDFGQLFETSTPPPQAHAPFSVVDHVLAAAMLNIAMRASDAGKVHAKVGASKWSVPEAFAAMERICHHTRFRKYEYIPPTMVKGCHR